MAIRKILIVDDSPTERHVLNDMLTKSGFEVVASDNGEDAILKAKSLRPDLILMDLSLPGLDGLAATRSLRDDPATRHLTIIALTAHAMKGDEAVALSAGCDGYLTKPIDTRTFAASVAAFIAAAESRLPQPYAACQYAN